MNILIYFNFDKIEIITKVIMQMIMEINCCVIMKINLTKIAMIMQINCNDNANKLQ